MPTAPSRMREAGAGAVELDRLIHEPARLLVVALLAELKAADFSFLQREAELSNGNLSSHMSRLEEAGYVNVEKRFVDRRPQTIYRLTPRGREAWTEYRRTMRRLLG